MRGLIKQIGVCGSGCFGHVVLLFQYEQAAAQRAVAQSSDGRRVAAMWQCSVRVTSALRLVRNSLRTWCGQVVDRTRSRCGQDADSARTARAAPATGEGTGCGPFAWEVWTLRAADAHTM